MPLCFLPVSLQIDRESAHSANFYAPRSFLLSGFRLSECSALWILLRGLGSFTTLVLFTTSGHTLASWTLGIIPHKSKMNWFYKQYLSLFSFIASFNRVTAKKTHKSQLEIVDLESRVIGLTLGTCLIATSMTLGTLTLLGIWLTNISVDGSTLNLVLILILSIVAIFTISFKYRFEDEIHEVASHPKQQRMSILTFDILSILLVVGLFFFNVQLYRLLVN